MAFLKPIGLFWNLMDIIPLVALLVSVTSAGPYHPETSLLLGCLKKSTSSPTFKSSLSAGMVVLVFMALPNRALADTSTMASQCHL